MKKWFKKHKKEIIIGTGLTVTVGIGLLLYKLGIDSNPVEIDAEKIIEPITDWKTKRSEIDEDIFSNLAIKIEQLVFSDGIDNALLFETYTVPMPVNGNFENGSYDVIKNVQVIVKDAVEGAVAE